MASRLPKRPDDYPELLQALKERIGTVQVRATLSVNRELVLLYWQIGRDILARQRRKGWGAKVIDQIAADLGSAFPDMRGFSACNLRTLPAPQSDLAQELLKDPYNLDFLTLGPDVQERELHRGLVQHLRGFLLELGVGFAFVAAPSMPWKSAGRTFGWICSSTICGCKARERQAAALPTSRHFC